MEQTLIQPFRKIINSLSTDDIIYREKIPYSNNTCCDYSSYMNKKLFFFN